MAKTWGYSDYETAWVQDSCLSRRHLQRALEGGDDLWKGLKYSSLDWIWSRISANQNFTNRWRKPMICGGWKLQARVGTFAWAFGGERKRAAITFPWDSLLLKPLRVARCGSEPCPVTQLGTETKSSWGQKERWPLRWWEGWCWGASRLWNESGEFQDLHWELRCGTWYWTSC